VLAVAAAMAGSGAGCACAEALVWPFIGRHVHEVSGVLPRRTGEGNHGAMRDGRGAQGLPAGGAAGDPAGSTGERGMGRDASRGGSTRGTRGNAIMGLGRAADRSGGGRRGLGGGTPGAAWPTRRCARALWRLTGSNPFELHYFEIPKLLKIELHSKTYK
jgi:hypothetical protein